MPLDPYIPLMAKGTDINIPGAVGAAANLQNTIAQTGQIQQNTQNLNTKNQTEQFALANDKLNTLSDLTFGVKDQASYDAALNRAKMLGISGLEKAPPEYNSDTILGWQNTLRQSQQQLALKAQQSGINLQGAEAAKGYAEANLAKSQSGIYPNSNMGAPQSSQLQQPQTNISNTGQQSTSNTSANDAYLTQFQPAVGSQIKALAEGRMPFPSGMELKTPYWQQMLSAVTQYDPSFDAVNYNARAAVRKSATSGPIANNIGALNTAIYHAGNLMDSVDQLNNTSIPGYNAVKNYLGTQLGNADIQAATSKVNTDIIATSHELAKVFRSSGMSEGEVRDWEKQISTSNSPTQNKEAIGAALDLMDGRLYNIGEQYNKGMGTTADPLQLLSPKAQMVYQSLRAKVAGEAQTAQSPAQMQQNPLQSSGAPQQGGWSIQRIK